MGPRLKLPKYVHAFIDRHGTPRFYFRRAGVKKVRLPGMPWSPEFMDAYEAATNNGALPLTIGIKRTRPGTAEEAVARYLGSMDFNQLAPSTQAMRRAILERFRVEHGDKRIRKLGTRAYCKAHWKAETVCTKEHAQDPSRLRVVRGR